MVTRVTPDARHALLDNRFIVRMPSGETEQRTLDAADLGCALSETLGLPVTPTGAR